MSLKEIIKEKRPSLSTSSITTYNSILTNLYKKVFGKEEIHLGKFNDVDPIIHFLKDQEPSKRKTTLSALVILTDNDHYRKLMLSDISDYNKEMEKQEKSQSQKESWVSEQEIKDTYEKLKKEADFLYKKPALTMSDLQLIQNYIILSLLGGIFIPVRRSLDYVNLKKSGQIDKQKDNFIDWKNNKLVFNIFKTAKWTGTQELEIPQELKKILTKWAKTASHTDYVLFDNNSNPLTSVKLNQRFVKIFGGKKASTNALRHSYLTTKFGDQIEKKKQMENIAKQMGTSAQMVEHVYIKHDN
jgi:integrase